MKTCITHGPGRFARVIYALTLCFAFTPALRLQAQNVVTQWNDIAITQTRASTQPGATSAGGTSLYVEYVQLAVYNSIVGIEGKYEPYKYSVPAPHDASPEAATVEAAYRILLHLLPDRESALTAAYNLSMAAIPDGTAKTAGQSAGLFSANSLIALRSGDGLGVAWAYTYPSTPVAGVYIPTPGFTSLVTPWAGQMRPFSFNDPAQFLPDEPPTPLNSREWAEDYNQVKLLGAVNSTVRTPAQTEIGRFWTDHTTTQYGRMLQLLAVQANMDLLDSSRLMAMSFTSIADSYIGCINAKYHFSFWRPVTAIRNADIDGNELTVADPQWTPLAVTPGHPEYPAAHACLTGSLANTLQQFFGTPHVHLAVRSAVTNTTRYFDNVHELEREIEGARIYAGFHYHHSLVQGFVLGHKVSQNMTQEYFAPVKKRHSDQDR
jgi:hypothetical protein